MKNKLSPVQCDEIRKVLREFHHESRNSEHQLDSQRVGKILTVVDGCIADLEQRKAVKDLLKQAYYENTHYLKKFWAHHIAEALGVDYYSATEKKNRGAIYEVPANQEINPLINNN